MKTLLLLSCLLLSPVLYAAPVSVAGAIGGIDLSTGMGLGVSPVAVGNQTGWLVYALDANGNLIAAECSLFYRGTELK